MVRAVIRFQLFLPHFNILLCAEILAIVIGQSGIANTQILANFNLLDLVHTSTRTSEVFQYFFQLFSIVAHFSSHANIKVEQRECEKTQHISMIFAADLSPKVPPDVSSVFSYSFERNIIDGGQTAR